MSFQKSLTVGLLLVLACLCVPNAASAFQAVAPPTTPPVAAPTKKLTALKMQRDRLKLRIEKSQQATDSLRVNIAAEQESLDSLNISADAFDEVVTMLQTKRINWMIELAGLEARQNEAKKLAESTSPAGFQKELVDVMQKMTKNAKENAKRVEEYWIGGTASKEQFFEAQQMHVGAELKLAELRAEIGGGSASQPKFVNQMLVEVSLAKAERTAQLELVDAILNKSVSKARKIISRLDRYQWEFDWHTKSLQEDASALSKLEDLIMRDEMKADF